MHACSVQKRLLLTQVISGHDNTLVELDGNYTSARNNGRLGVSVGHRHGVVIASVGNVVIIFTVDVIARAAPVNRVVIHCVYVCNVLLFRVDVWF